ncbi:2'-phosphotransferase [Vigna unguiculata]|uniref:2'-phosphotransferase n=1 Tax=Vigna unguiculata TaxID=3917 RepID=A0A4D6MMZ5_VIGUN|nr:2'-phosphotransferase [Vigna unguiculata]
MFASVSNSSSINILRRCALLRPRVLTLEFCSLLHRFGASAPMDNGSNNRFSSYAHASSRLLLISPSPSSKLTNSLSLFSSPNASVQIFVNFEGFVWFREWRGGESGSGKDKIDALGRLLTRILRHMASELNLKMRNDGFVKVNDLLKLNMKTFANIPLRSHTVDDIKEAVRRDNKQRFSLMEENGELLIRANQGHTVTTVETESLLKPILSAEEVPGMRRDVNVLIFIDVRKALEEGMKLYISDNKVILTEGFDGVVPPKFFEKIESWPSRQPIPF